jgi:hypothetical protein
MLNMFAFQFAKKSQFSPQPEKILTGFYSSKSLAATPPLWQF